MGFKKYLFRINTVYTWFNFSVPPLVLNTKQPMHSNEFGFWMADTFFTQAGRLQNFIPMVLGFGVLLLALMMLRPSKISLPTRSLTASFPLKNDGWLEVGRRSGFLVGKTVTFQGRSVQLREGKSWNSMKSSSIFLPQFNESTTRTNIFLVLHWRHWNCTGAFPQKDL